MNRICGYSCEHNKGGVCQMTMCDKQIYITTKTDEPLQKQLEKYTKYKIQKDENFELRKIHELQQELEEEKRINQEDLKVIHKLEERVGKAAEYIKMNCITSDTWEDLGFCNFVPTGNIKYKSLSAKKVKEVIDILEGRSDE